MMYKTVLLLFFSTLAISTGNDTAEVAERDMNINFSSNPAAVFRYANFPSHGGHNIQARQEDCGCRENEKCCSSPEDATFCVPKDASCCGRTWCNGELEICCLDGPHGGCCPKDTMCASGGKGCCLKDRPCFGPFICHDYSSTQCTPGNTTVEPFQCCPASAPWCLFDPENGYGCFIGKILPTYSRPMISIPTDVVKAPTDTLTFGVLTIPVNSTRTSTPVGSSTSNPEGSIVTSEPASISVIETSKPSDSAIVIRTTTTKKNSTQPPKTTDSVGSAATGSSSYAFLGVAGLALIMLG